MAYAIEDIIVKHTGSRASGIMDDGCEEKYLLISVTRS
jgi:hypothetical protein